MGVGDHHHPTTRATHGFQKCRHVGAHGDQVYDLFLELHNIEREFATPEVEAIPVEGAGVTFVMGGEMRACDLRSKTVKLCIAPRHVLKPEVVVEVQIEQGAVHVEKDGIDE